MEDDFVAEIGYTDGRARRLVHLKPSIVTALDCADATVRSRLSNPPMTLATLTTSAQRGERMVDRATNIPPPLARRGELPAAPNRCPQREPEMGPTA